MCQAKQKDCKQTKGHGSRSLPFSVVHHCYIPPVRSFCSLRGKSCQLIIVHVAFAERLLYAKKKWYLLAFYSNAESLQFMFHIYTVV
uniref:Uncharacterized protein n=1 Tax=uncultured bacterium 9F08 TaxID=697051 RepID=D2XIS9_9BACT|nr:hypothetical protein [uncultured bacterium 9F08]